MTNPKERHNKALELLQTGVRETLTSDAWKKALDFRRSNANRPYSLSNLLLIMQQAPDASLVAGFNVWKQRGRSVRKGEKGIMILAPMGRKVEEEDGTETYRVFGFRTAYVFDITQTDGEDYDVPPTAPLLDGHDEPAAAAILMLETFATNRGWKLNHTTPASGARGTWSPTTNTITVDPTMPALQRAKTLAHEIAHAVAGHIPNPEQRSIHELQAETTAYLVSAALGLDTSSYSFNYLAHWTGDVTAMDYVLDAGRTATKLADEILAGLPEVAAQDAMAA